MKSCELMKRLRKKLGLKQICFAEILGISQGCLSKIEAGHLDSSLEAFLIGYRIVRKHRLHALIAEFESFVRGEKK